MSWYPSGVSNPSTVESRAASALASALPARATSRAAVVPSPRRTTPRWPRWLPTTAPVGSHLPVRTCSDPVVLAAALLPDAAVVCHVGRQSDGQLPCGDVCAFRHLSVVQDLRDVAGDWSLKHLYTCFRSAEGALPVLAPRGIDSCPDGELGGVLFAARHGLAKAGVQLKYMGSKSWLAPHLDLLLGDVSVLHSSSFQVDLSSPNQQAQEFCTKCLLVHPTPAGCAMRWQAS